MRGCIYLILLVTITYGFAAPAPLDQLAINLNILDIEKDSPTQYGDNLLTNNISDNKNEDAFENGNGADYLKQSYYRRRPSYGADYQGISMSNNAAMCSFHGDGTGELHGVLFIDQHENSKFRGQVSGLAPGVHGFHVHENGDLGDNCKDAGGHFNPHDVNHGGKDAKERHVGDLGNLEVNEYGMVNIDFRDHMALLNDANSIIGKTLVIHEGEDDLGLGGDKGSITTGNAGPRAGCCIISSLHLPMY